ncbi:MAG: hypothetical protein IJZ74_12225 [Clostridia bacterium]|nr:hypothetical protein [Clostridia bacterium]
MKKKAVFVLLTAMLLCVSAAMAAEGPAYSPEMQALLQANQALTDRYGLTRGTLGLFNTNVEQYGDTFIVTYTTTDAIHESLTGTYAVIVTDGKSSAYWTHDDLDPALWQTGSLTSPAWGVKQLQAYLDAGPAGRNGFCLPYLSDEAIANDDPAELARLWQDEYVYPLVTADGTEAMDSTKARALSKAALINAYSLTEAEMNSAAFLWCDLYLRPNGSLMWEVGYYLDADEEYNFYVTLDAVTGEILSLSHGTGGIG